MLNKLIVSGLCLALLAGCDASSKAEQENAVAQAEQQASNTALYFPGGAGVDFGREPISDKVVEDKSSKIRIVSYEFTESYEEIDKSIASIIEEAGYVRKVNSSGKNELSVTYRKQGAKPVLSRYAVRVQEGFDKNTILTLSWRF